MRERDSNSISRRLCIALLFITSYTQAESCLTETSIRTLDLAYEQAVLTGDETFAIASMHPEFTWVHNHASSVQRSRAELLKAFNRTKQMSRNKHDRGHREQSDVEVVIVGDTAVIHGYTLVRRPEQFIERFGSDRISALPFHAYLRCDRWSLSVTRQSHHGNPQINLL